MVNCSYETPCTVMTQEIQSNREGLGSDQNNPNGIYGVQMGTGTGSFSEHFRIPSSRSFLVRSTLTFRTTIMEAT